MGSDDLEEAVRALPPAWKGFYFAAVDSTQDEARTAARRGAADRSLFVADYQRTGRGRQGRTWLAPPGSALLVSMLFRETTSDPAPWRWTSLASVALAEAIEQLLPAAAPAIKWPNDVMLGERKVAGILAETSWNGQVLQAIVGVGVNVVADAGSLASLPGATSLGAYAGRPVGRGTLLLELVRRVDRWYERPLDELFSVWQGRLWRRGQRLRLLDLGREEEVVVLGAERDGSLRVRLADGSERRTTTGELLP
jgi:BirA family transcriptional regulator, biotin operon repressor / biotin---[acetyl-CoA-carboxylase] ligase